MKNLVCPQSKCHDGKDLVEHTDYSEHKMKQEWTTRRNRNCRTAFRAKPGLKGKLKVEVLTTNSMEMSLYKVPNEVDYGYYGL